MTQKKTQETGLPKKGLKFITIKNTKKIYLYKHGMWNDITMSSLLFRLQTKSILPNIPQLRLSSKTKLAFMNKMILFQSIRTNNDNIWELFLFWLTKYSNDWLVPAPDIECHVTHNKWTLYFNTHLKNSTTTQNKCEIIYILLWTYYKSSLTPACKHPGKHWSPPL